MQFTISDSFYINSTLNCVQNDIFLSNKQYKIRFQVKQSALNNLMSANK